MQVTSRTAVDMPHLLRSPPVARLDVDEPRASQPRATTGFPHTDGVGGTTHAATITSRCVAPVRSTRIPARRATAATAAASAGSARVTASARASRPL